MGQNKTTTTIKPVKTPQNQQGHNKSLALIKRGSNLEELTDEQEGHSIISEHLNSKQESLEELTSEDERDNDTNSDSLPVPEGLSEFNTATTEAGTTTPTESFEAEDSDNDRNLTERSNSKDDGSDDNNEETAHTDGNIVQSRGILISL